MTIPIPEVDEPDSERDPLSEEERHRLGGAGVGLDGRKYRYKSFSYDNASDTLNHSRPDQNRLDPKCIASEPTAWVDAIEPTAAERRQMATMGITHDGRHYRYMEYRFDRLVDAVNYAHLKH